MLFRVRFHNEEKLYELYAKSVHQSDMFGFLVIEDLVFGEQSQVIVNPQEDQLRVEFSGTSKIYVPLHNVVMIEEVRRRGKARILKSDFKSDRPTLYAGKPKEKS